MTMLLRIINASGRNTSILYGKNNKLRIESACRKVEQKGKIKSRKKGTRNYVNFFIHPRTVSCHTILFCGFNA